MAVYRWNPGIEYPTLWLNLHVVEIRQHTDKWYWAAWENNRVPYSCANGGPWADADTAVYAALSRLGYTGHKTFRMGV